MFLKMLYQNFITHFLIQSHHFLGPFRHLSITRCTSFRTHVYSHKHNNILTKLKFCTRHRENSNPRIWRPYCTSFDVACILITQPFCQLTNTSDFMSQTRVRFMWAVEQGQMKGKFYNLSTHCIAMHTLQNLWKMGLACWIRPRYQSWLRTETAMSSNMTYLLWGWRIPWRSFIGATSTIAQWVHSMCQCSGSTQSTFSQ
jgi:hypothetical protein